MEQEVDNSKKTTTLFDLLKNISVRFKIRIKSIFISECMCQNKTVD